MYNRIAAVAYADRWWNSANPAYPSFPVDCTNYISQCLYAGGAPMWGAPDRERGWWITPTNWSFSWATAHSLRWYLATSTKGLVAEIKKEARELQLGDVISYDFGGDGRYDHSTIVTAFDEDGEPLVNAHTGNSFHRPWRYTDSTAFTDRTIYTFFHLSVK